MAELHHAPGVRYASCVLVSMLSRRGQRPLFGKGRHGDGPLVAHGPAHLQERRMERVVVEAAMLQ
jgi:hypothetical protein